ncbi:MAG: hypothetical protein CL920_00010 [Deltaproteobacteria bacterium]|nr:hypothetical protein [Deltaproteobacteria bacterium]
MRVEGVCGGPHPSSADTSVCRCLNASHFSLLCPKIVASQFLFVLAQGCITFARQFVPCVLCLRLLCMPAQHAELIT